jgi:hypothetical protein
MDSVRTLVASLRSPFARDDGAALTTSVLVLAGALAANRARASPTRRS